MAQVIRNLSRGVNGQRMREGMKVWGTLIIGEAQRNAARVFRKNTQGGLRQSMHFTQPTNTTLVIRVPKKYAAIHEYGGRTRPHVIRARRGGVLRFVMPGGEVVFARSVNHPGSKIREKRYIRDAIDKTRIAGEKAISDALLEGRI